VGSVLLKGRCRCSGRSRLNQAASWSENTENGKADGLSLTLTTGAQNFRKLLILRSSIQKVFTTLLTPLTLRQARPGCKFVGAAEAAEPDAVAAIAIDDPSLVVYSGEG
jgi:hypothetical protein